MSLPEFVNEAILVQARFMLDGRIVPTAFIWRGRTRCVADTGREWQEEADGTTWRCYLVRTPTRETFELRLGVAGSRGLLGRWMLARAWLRPVSG